MRTLLIFGLTLWSTSALAQDPAEKQTAEKGPVSEFEFTKQQRALFAKADLNFDGRITRDESQMTRFENQKKGYEKRFKTLDENSSGFLESAEIERWHVEQSEKRIAGLTGQRERLLKKYDLDQNGTISAYELDEAFKARAEEEREKAFKSAERDFSSKDKDESGSVSLEEYIQSKAPRPRRAAPMGDMAKRSIVQDADGDGVITRSEHETYITKIFQHLDKNDDGELSKQEQSPQMMGAFEDFQPNSIYMISEQFPGVSIELKDR